MRQSACLVVNPITVTVDSYGFLSFIVGQASDLMMALMISSNPLVGAWCLSLAGPTIAQHEILFSSDYL